MTTLLDHDTVARPILQAMLSLPTSQRSELQVCHLAQEKATLEVQLEEVTHLLRSEREAAHRREQELPEKMAEANSQIADLTSTNTGTCLYHSAIFVAVFVSPTVVVHFVPSPPSLLLYSSPHPHSFPPHTHTHTQCWTVRWWTCVCVSSRQTKSWRSCGWRGRQRGGCMSLDSWNTCRG